MAEQETQVGDLEEGKEFLPQFQKRGGLLPAIVQDHETREVLMLGWVNDQALSQTLQNRLATFWSTSRQELWVKGATSGDFLEIVEILVDCDQDALIYLVRPRGEGACHTKDNNGCARTSCFYRKLNFPRETLGDDRVYLTFAALRKRKKPVNRE